MAATVNCSTIEELVSHFTEKTSNLKRCMELRNTGLCCKVYRADLFCCKVLLKNLFLVDCLLFLKSCQLIELNFKIIHNFTMYYTLFPHACQIKSVLGKGEGYLRDTTPLLS